MTERRANWLDAIAFNVDRGMVRGDREIPASTSTEEQLSRRRFGKLVVAALASASFAQLQTRPASAQAPDECDCADGCGCAKAWGDFRSGIRKFCLDKWLPGWSKLPAWRRALENMFWPKTQAELLLADWCTLENLNKWEQGLYKCEVECKERCGKRTSQSRFQVCEQPPSPPIPPSKQYTSPPPPAPSAAQDACWACRQGNNGNPVFCCVNKDFEACACFDARVAEEGGLTTCPC